MAIDKDYLEYLAEPSPSTFKDTTFTYIKTKIEEAIKLISINQPDINLQNTEIYLQGAYVNDTFVTEDTKLEVVVEITRPNDVINTELNRLNPTLKRPTEEMRNVYTLPEFKNDLQIELINVTKNEKIVKSNKTISVPKSFKTPILIEILPAFKAEEYESGSNLLVYNSYANIYLVSYPKVHSKNMAEKEKIVGEIFKKVIRVTRRLKNILVSNEVITPDFAPGYFLDCLFYNIPNTLFRGDLYDVYLKILNYLKNSNLAHFTCAHEKFKMFNNGIDGWDYYKARKFIDLLIYAWRNLEIQ